jgi:hypothetical protein
MAEGSDGSSTAIVAIVFLAIAAAIAFFLFNGGAFTSPQEKNVKVELNVPKPQAPEPGAGS